MRTVLTLSLIATAALTLAAPAAATVTICTGSNCVATDENVLVNSATSVATVLGTTNNTGVGVTFTSTTDAFLNGDANGQAEVSAADGLLNGLTFTLADGKTFATAIFNLFPLAGNQDNEATSVIIRYFTPGLGEQQVEIDTNGQNFLGISGDAGERFTAVGFIGAPSATGIADLRQLRLGGVDAPSRAVPEPGTWAMMLLGFGAVGASLRRRKRGALQAV